MADTAETVSLDKLSHSGGNSTALHKRVFLDWHTSYHNAYVAEKLKEEAADPSESVRWFDRSLRHWIPEELEASHTRTFQVLQKWVGEITDIDDSSVWALIAHEDSPEHFIEVVELAIEDFQMDQDVLEVGMVFYWSLGYEYHRGTARKYSDIRVRRTPKWSHAQVEAIRLRAKGLAATYKNG